MRSNIDAGSRNEKAAVVLAEIKKALLLQGPEEKIHR
jgi:hypothetical protein